MTIVLLVAVTTVAHAQVPPTKAAEATFLKGRELMKEKKYAQACEAFEQSQRLDPQYGTQYNLAGCYVELGKLASAWNVYRELSRSDNNPDRKQASADEAAKLAARVPKISIRFDARPDGTQLTLDGADALALVGVETPVDLGAHRLVATAPGHKTSIKAVDVREEGKTVEVAIQLEPGTDASGVVTDPNPGPVDAAPASNKKLYGKIATFAGAGLTVTGLIFGGVAMAKWNDAKAAMDNTIVRSARKYGNLSTGFVAVGLTATAAGLFLWLTAPEKPDDRARVTATLDGESAGFAVTGRF